MSIEINEYSNIYFNLPEEERDINTWVDVLEKYIYSICHKYNNFFTFEERFQIAWVGATKAIRTFDITKGFKFTTYLSFVVKNELLLNRRAAICKLFLEPKNHDAGMYTVISLESDVKTKNGSDDSIKIEDVLQDFGPRLYDEVIAKTDIEYLIKSCKKDIDKKIVKYLYQGYTQQEIANILNCAQPTIARRITRLRNKNKRLLKEYRGV